jgi:hypothetical protein
MTLLSYSGAGGWGGESAFLGLRRMAQPDLLSIPAGKYKKNLEPRAAG